MIRCAQNPGNAEYTLCGWAFDAFESGDVDTPIVQAKSGEVITCPDCRSAIAEIKSIKRWKQP